MENAVANSFDADMAHQRMAMPLTIRPSVPLQSAKRFRKSVHRINEELRQWREEMRSAKQARRSDPTQGKINKQCICMRPECKGWGKGKKGYVGSRANEWVFAIKKLLVYAYAHLCVGVCLGVCVFCEWMSSTNKDRRRQCAKDVQTWPNYKACGVGKRWEKIEEAVEVKEWKLKYKSKSQNELNESFELCKLSYALC